MPTENSSLKDEPLSSHRPLIADEEREYLMVVAYLFLQHGKWEKALTLYEALDRIVPGDLQVLKGLVVSGFHTGRLDQTLKQVEQWENAATSREEKTMARMMRARILWRLGHHEAARATWSPREEENAP